MEPGVFAAQGAIVVYWYHLAPGEHRTFEAGPEFSITSVPAAWRFKQQWWPGGEDHNGGVLVLVPLWIPLLVSFALAAVLWRADALGKRRLLQRFGRCAKCGYDRRGLAVGVKCPECGTVP